MMPLIGSLDEGDKFSMGWMRVKMLRAKRLDTEWQVVRMLMGYGFLMRVLYPTGVQGGLLFSC